jgi:hypothetical protein
MPRASRGDTTQDDAIEVDRLIDTVILTLWVWQFWLAHSALFG